MPNGVVSQMGYEACYAQGAAHARATGGLLWVTFEWSVHCTFDWSSGGEGARDKEGCVATLGAYVTWDAVS